MRIAVVLVAMALARAAQAAPAELVYEVDVGQRYDARKPPAAVTAQIVERLRERLERVAETGPEPTRGATVRIAGQRIVVQLPDAAAATERLRGLLGRTARLELLAVDDAAAFWPGLVAKAARTPGVQAQVDRWSDGQNARAIDFLEADRCDAIEAAVKATKVKVPATHRVLYEEFVRAAGPRCRSHTVLAKAELDSDDVADAEVQVERNGDLPMVTMGFTPAGAKRFEAFTGRWIGRRIAIAFEGRVMSDPVVMSAITGGRASLSMAGDPATREARAKDLVLVLRTGQLAAPVKLVGTR